jgi:hypothetical protein
MGISAGIIGEVMFSPKLYLSYDFTREDFNTVLSAS